MDTFSLVATKLYQMRTFCKSVMRQAAFGSHDLSAEQERGVRYVSCRTYEAFADSLLCCLEEMTEDVRGVEKAIVEHGGWVECV